VFDSRLPPDLREGAGFYVLFGMWNGHQPRMYWVAKLMMASFRSYTFPAMPDQNSNDIRTFHIPTLP
jgi:hypothetical protein